MIIFDGNGEAISFNDEGSPDTRQTNHTKVCVNGQVDRGTSLDWFHKLLAFFPDIPGELKSSVILARFNNLPREVQDRVWRSLQRVRIHIVDPRPHFRRMHEILREASNEPDAPRKLRQMADEGSLAAQRLLGVIRENVANSILSDSTAVRAHNFGRAFANPILNLNSEFPYFRNKREEFSQVISLNDFTLSESRNIVRDVVSWSAKSSSAFYAALDAATSMPDESMWTTYRFDFGNVVRAQMTKTLLPAHAFDKGNRRHLALLEKTRQAMIEDFSRGERLYARVGRPGFVEVESKSSYYIQAADFAAGIASDIYAKHKLVGVVKHFEHVTFNGIRVSLADAEEVIRKEKIFA